MPKTRKARIPFQISICNTNKHSMMYQAPFTVHYKCEIMNPQNNPIQQLHYDCHPQMKQVDEESQTPKFRYFFQDNQLVNGRANLNSVSMLLTSMLH